MSSISSRTSHVNLDLTQMAAEYDAGATLRQLATKYQHDRRAIARAIREAGGKIRSSSETNGPRLQALAATRRALTDLQELDLVRRYIAGESGNRLARAFRISYSLAYQILRRRGAYREQRCRQCSLNESVFDDALASEEASYFVGLLMADGCLHQPKTSKGASWTVTLGLTEEDSGHIEAYRHFLGSTHKIVIQTNKGYGVQGEPLHSLAVPSDRLAHELMKYGLTPRKSGKEVAKGGMEDCAAFWRGCVDGDGWVSIRPAGSKRTKRVSGKGTHYSLNRLPACILGLVGSKMLLSQFAAFSRTVVSNHARPAPMNSIWSLRFSGRAAYHIARILYASASVALPRKHRTALRILAECDRFI